jgi:serine/threonine-protein phosphatase 4 regulatory subunit 2
MDGFFRERGFTGPITETFSSRKDEILRLLDDYDSQPPFTVQRLCEVILDADKQFKSTYALLNSITKLLSVTSTVS